MTVFLRPLHRFMSLCSTCTSRSICGEGIAPCPSQGIIALLDWYEAFFQRPSQGLVALLDLCEPQVLR